MQPRAYPTQLMNEVGEEQIKLANQICHKSNKYLFDLYSPSKISNMLEKVFLLELENAFS